jgi:hypothetical protein
MGALVLHPVKVYQGRFIAVKLKLNTGGGKRVSGDVDKSGINVRIVT